MNNQETQRKGFRKAKAEPTGSASQHIFRSLGYKVANEVKYREFLFGGETVFANVTECDSCQLAYKVL